MKTLQTYLLAQVPFELLNDSILLDVVSVDSDLIDLY